MLATAVCSALAGLDTEGADAELGLAVTALWTATALLAGAWRLSRGHA